MGFLDSISKAADSIKKGAENAASNLENTAQNAASSAKNAAQNAASSAQNMAQNATSSMQNAAQNAESSAQKAAQNATNSIQNAAQNATNAAQNMTQNVASTAQNAAQNAASSVQNAAQNATSSMQNMAQNATSSIQNAAQNATSQLESTAQNAASSVQNAAQNAAGQMEQAMSSAQNMAQDTSEWDLYQPCGLQIRIDPPENSDSVHISVYNDGSVYHLYRDKVIHPKSNPAGSFRELSVNEDPDDLKDSDWEYGKFFMAETVFCGDKKTVFPVVSFNIRKGRTSAFIETFYSTKKNYYDSTGTISTLHEHFDYNSSLSPNYDFASIDKDSTYYKLQRFVPIVNDCGVDSTYFISINYTEECHEQSDNYLF